MHFKEQHFASSDVSISTLAINGKIPINFNGLESSSYRDPLKSNNNRGRMGQLPSTTFCSLNSSASVSF